MPIHFPLNLSPFSAAAGLTVGDFIAELDVPVPGLESAKPWIPKLNVGGDSDGNITTALQVSLKSGGVCSS